MANIDITQKPPHDTDVKLAEAWLEKAKHYTIVEAHEYALIARDRAAMVAQRNELDEKRKEATSELDKAKKIIMGWYAPAIEFLKQAIVCADSAMRAYDTNRERERARELQDAREKAKREREKLEFAAAKAKAKGRTEEAKALEIAAETTPLTVAVTPQPAVPGQVTVRRWKAEIDDELKLIQAIARGEVSVEAVKVNKSFLDAQARSLKGHFSIPGCRAVCVKGYASRKDK